MEETKTIKEKTIELIDALKATCQTYGMGNDGNEYKIITQVFLYKFLNDKFGYEVKKVSMVLKNAEKWELAYAEMSEDDRLDIFDSLPSDIPLLNPEHLIANLWNQQAKGDFDLIFDSTMTDMVYFEQILWYLKPIIRIYSIFTQKWYNIFKKMINIDQNKKYRRILVHEKKNVGNVTDWRHVRVYAGWLWFFQDAGCFFRERDRRTGTGSGRGSTGFGIRHGIR